MARRREEEQARLLERGGIEFYYRPHGQAFHGEHIGDVQRLLIVLSPEARDRFRVIAAGRKRVPAGERRDRFWGFVDLVLDAPIDLKATLSAQTYGPRRRAVRHLPAACLAAEGSYTISFHDGEAHLRWQLAKIHDEDDRVRELDLDKSGDAIVTVANPDPAAWGLSHAPPLQSELFDEAELHVTIPTHFPPELQSRFEDRRFLPLDSMAFLNHPGAELVFVWSS